MDPKIVNAKRLPYNELCICGHSFLCEEGELNAETGYYYMPCPCCDSVFFYLKGY